MCAIIGVNHGKRISESIGNLLQTQLQAAIRILNGAAQIFGQPFIAQQMRIAVIWVIQLEVLTKPALVMFEF